MKAITCSQCGALIEDVSVNKKFTKCDYCNAKFRLQAEKVFDISRQEAQTINARFQKPVRIQTTKTSKKAFIPAILLLLLFLSTLSITFFFIFKSRSTVFSHIIPKLKVEMSITAKLVVTGGSFDLSNIEMLNFDNTEFPNFSESQFPDMDADEMLETVFEERKINVEVEINKKGNITKAKAINGHEYLKRICEEAALKTTFFTPAPSDVTVIYLFSVKKR